MQELQGAVATPVPDDYVKLACKNAAWLQVIAHTPLHTDTATLPLLKYHAEEALDNPTSLFLWYLLFHAADRFFHTRHHYPGQYGKPEDDAAELKSEANALLSDMGLSPAFSEDHVQEFCRFGNAELHNISAFLGGVIAQETIKLVTHQFVPVNNTVVYSAISGGLEVFEL